MGIITLQYRQGRNKNWIMSWPCILWSGFQILDINNKKLKTGTSLKEEGGESARTKKGLGGQEDGEWRGGRRRGSSLSAQRSGLRPQASRCNACNESAHR